MSLIYDYLFPALKTFYCKFISKPSSAPLEVLRDFDTVSDIIYNLIISDKPCMVARYGSTELSCVVNYMGVTNKRHSLLKYIKGEQLQWWWNKKILNQMQQWSGFFPSTERNAERFSRMMLEDSGQLDLLAAWSPQSIILSNYYKNVIKTSLISIEPYWSSRPWTRALAGKKVLVIHPFANQIRLQYQNHRKNLFKNSEVLPVFELHTIAAVQSLGGSNQKFDNWFQALDWMKAEMDKIDYDIALIGCGAYGFPLAAHSKRTGHKAIHLAGALQLLFGIKGHRWENPQYGKGTFGHEGAYLSLFNENWIYPGQEGRPMNANSVEGACYW